MRPTLRDSLVLCDMDNTLLTAAEGIPSCNRTVIRLYVGMGGRFTVATGRPPESIRAALGGLRLPLPVISCNGSLIVDLESGDVLYSASVDKMQASLAVRDIHENFPGVSVAVMAAGGEMYVVHANARTHALQVDEHIGSVACPLDSVPDDWNKVIFAADPDTLDRVARFTKTRYYGRENYFVRTNSIYYEIMPTGVSKASALQQLCALTGVPQQNVVAIGDYYNDLELMRAAGYAVAVANAPAEVKAEADEVTLCSCSEGGVGEFLYRLTRSRQAL